MGAAGVLSVFASVRGMTVCAVGVMRRLFVTSSFVMLCCLLMMTSSMTVVLRRGPMMLCRLF
jgi:hypothetical protein